METSGKKLRKKIGSVHIQAHNYPSRREIIEKCESGSVKPLLRNEGRGRTLKEMKESQRMFEANWDAAFGGKK